MESLRKKGSATDTRPPAQCVLVLGGSGFIGRHTVTVLLGMGCRVVIGSRYPERIDARLPREAQACERRSTRFADLLTANSWSASLAGIDVVINCVGILRQRGRDSYDRIHHRAPAALACACGIRGTRLIHVSALGLDAPARSRFLKSKRAGEEALRASGADWQIVRPSLLDGPDGFGARWLRRVARWPIHPVPSSATGRVAVLDVRDLGVALARLALAPVNTTSEPGTTSEIGEREFDLGGTEQRTLGEHLAALRRLTTTRPALQLPISGLVARLASHVCDLLHLTPFSFGHFELLRRDNYPERNRLPELLGRTPRAVGLRGSAVEKETLPQFASATATSARTWGSRVSRFRRASRQGRPECSPRNGF